MRYIPLTQGQFTIVRDCWFEELSKYKWFALKVKNTFYACRRERGTHFGKRGTILMHRVITSAPEGMEVDHRDRNGLNNDDDNLRLVPHMKNAWNRRMLSTNTSGFKGVWWSKRRSKWCAEILENNRKHILGFFVLKIDAAFAYNKAALLYHGEFASLNIIPDDYVPFCPGRASQPFSP
jgi:HNH endonuclease